LLVLLASLLRLNHLDFESLFMDELQQTYLYSNSYYSMIEAAARQQQPPLDYWIGKLFLLFGNTDFTVRLPAALFGVASVWLLYRIIGRETQPSIAFAAAVTMAILPYHIYFSQYARPYAIAIFFFLALLHCLQIIANSAEMRWSRYIVLFVVSFCFLMSRTLAPLAVMGAIILMVVVATTLKYTRYSDKVPLTTRRLMAVLGAIMLALVAYTPFLLNITQVSGRYLKAKSSMLDTIANGFANFSLVPMWQSYITQTEPLGWILLPLLIAAYWQAVVTNKLFLRFAAILLPVVIVINLFVFQAKVNYTFRPPYAIYLLPMILLFAAIGLRGILEKVPHSKQFAARVSVALLAVLVTGFTLHSTLQFKALRKVSDWRALAHYFQTPQADQQVLIFGTLNPYSTWEPRFYGFPRYYHGNYQFANLAGLPGVVSNLQQIQLNPVLIMFYYRDYFLTPDSSYPFHPAMAYPMSLDISKIEQDSTLKLVKFTSFYVISLDQPRQNTLESVRALSEKILAHYPDNFSWVELQIVAATIKRHIGDDSWQSQLQHAIEITPPEYRATVQQIAKTLAQTS